MITNGALGAIKAMTAKFLTDTCTIEQRSLAVGEFGQPVEAYTVVSTGVACRVITIGNRFFAQQQNPETAGREHIMDAYRLIVPAGTALDVDYRVTLSNGDVYHVVDLITERTDETDSQAIIVRVR